MLNFYGWKEGGRGSFENEFSNFSAGSQKRLAGGAVTTEATSVIQCLMTLIALKNLVISGDGKPQRVVKGYISVHCTYQSVS